MLALSLDMGGSHIGCAVVRDRTILAARALPAQSAEGLAPLLPMVEQTLRELLQEAAATTADCTGIAVGFPGIIDTRTGHIVSTLKKYEDAKHMNLAAWGRERFALPLRMENDARMALLGEQFAGGARGRDNVVMMSLGTGIGGATMIQGRLLRGEHGQAGCLGGHLVVDYQGQLCQCGNVGCAEAEASGWALSAMVREHPAFPESLLAAVAEIDFRALFECADQGDQVAGAVQQKCLKVWAANVVSLIHAYDPEIVVMGGGVLRRADIIIPFVQEYVTRHAWTPWGSPLVRAAELGDQAALLGAVPLLAEAG